MATRSSKQDVGRDVGVRPRAPGSEDRCQGSGMVRVAIEVARNGNVTNAAVMEPIEGADKVCFANAAMAAARSSKFRTEINGPEKHRAVISYTFIAQ